VYDVTDKKTFEGVTYWMNSIQENADNGVDVILVGNKIDLTNDRVVSLEEGKALADKFSVFHIETSAKSGENVENAFLAILKSIFAKEKSKTVIHTEIIDTNKKEKKKNSKCC
jgi:Ras-related protein Rab-8A